MSGIMSSLMPESYYYEQILISWALVSRLMQ